MGHTGGHTATAHQPQCLLDLLVPEGVDDRVDDGVVGSRHQRGIGVEWRVGVVSDEGVDSERHPAGGERAQDDGQRRHALPCCDVVGCGGQEVVLEGDLMSVAHHNLADLDVQLQHEAEKQQEGDGEHGDVVLRQRPHHAAPAVPGDDEEVAAASPEPEVEVEKEAEAAVVELKSETSLETQTDALKIEDQTDSSPAAAPPTTEPVTMPAEPAPAAPEENRPFSWASVTSKNLPPSGAVPVISPHVIKATPAAPPRAEVKSETQTATQRPQRDQRPREQRPGGPPPVHRGPRPVREGEQGETEGRRVVRYPDAHQLFVGNVPHDVDKSELKEFFEQYGTVLELRINSGGKLPNFGFVVFDDSEPVQKILSNRPIKFRGDVRLNVEEKKTRSAREGDRRDVRPRGPGGPGGPRERIGGGGGPRGPPTRGGMAQKPSFGSGRGSGPSDGRYPAQRQ